MPIDFKVFVLGAGASYGDTLCPMGKTDGDQNRVPLIDGFFAAEFLNGSLPEIQTTYEPLLTRIRELWNIRDPFGSGMWAKLNLEEVFSFFSIENEFFPVDSDEKAQSQLLVNALKRYIERVIATASYEKYGKCSRLLRERLAVNDTIISFNYDLLLDQELSTATQYSNFKSILLEEPTLGDGTRIFSGDDPGLYLKMHGSLNWFVCTSDGCPHSTTLDIDLEKRSYRPALSGGNFICERCKGPMTSFIIPPLLNKPIIKSPLLRTIWSNARNELSHAREIVIVGYSFPPSDFHATWLFRSASQGAARLDRIWIVNPLNDPAHQDHKAFKDRLESIFSGVHLDMRYFRFDQIKDVLDEMKS